MTFRSANTVPFMSLHYIVLLSPGNIAILVSKVRRVVMREKRVRQSRRVESTSGCNDRRVCYCECMSHAYCGSGPVHLEGHGPPGGDMRDSIL